MSLYYDKPSDYLEIFAGTPTPNYGEEVPNKRGITLFKDNKTNEVIGIGISGFKKRSEILNKIMKKMNIDFPLNINP